MNSNKSVFSISSSSSSPYLLFIGLALLIN
jgi:hypothetical protein